jgi:hypothetical protein
MILRGAQIHRDGHGKSGLLLNPTLSRNNTPLPFRRCFFCGTPGRVSSTASVFFFNYKKGKVQPTLRLLV